MAAVALAAVALAAVALAGDWCDGDDAALTKRSVCLGGGVLDAIAR